MSTRSSVRYEAIEQMAVPLMIIDDHSVVVDLNPAAAAFFQVTPADALDHPLREVIGGWEEIITFCSQRCKSQIDVILTTEEQRRIFEARMEDLPTHSGRYWSIILVDVTDQRNIRDSFQKTERLFRLVSENTGDVVWIYDFALQQFVYITLSVESVFHYSNDFLKKSSLFTHLTPESAARAAKALKNRIAAFESGNLSERISTIELEQISSDGVVFPTEINSTLLTDEGGRVIQLLGVSRDITERKRTETALSEANQKIRLLTGIIRHDILNLLTSLHGFLFLAQESSEVSYIHENISRAREIGQKIKKIIGFTQEYEPIGSGSCDWHPIRDLIFDAMEEIDFGEVVVTNTIPPNLEIFTDSIMIKVYSSVLENAVRHGGTISRLNITHIMRQDTLVLIFEDDGCGIADYEKELIFSHKYGKNTGFGLFLAREIASLTGCSICERGVAGRGARFELHIPSGKYRIVPPD